MLITVPEAARRTAKNPETIRRWIRAGRLRSERVGTQHLVDADEVMALANDQPLGLPEEWTRADKGEMPSWERIVRDNRDSH